MIRLLMLALALLVAVPAMAQERPVRFSVGAGTDNRSKDVSKSDGDPYAWAQAEWSGDGGFYALAEVQTIDGGGSRVELAPKVGYAIEGLGFEWNVSAAYKYRVDAAPGYDEDAWEFTADVQRAFGPAKARLRLQHSPDGTGSTKAWTWTAVRLAYALTDALKASAEVGHRAQDASPDYTGWNAGFDYAVTREISLSLYYYATDADDAGRQYDDALVAGVAYRF